jgi:tRNA A-37 threonylcarbamoyl transferase component Bud32
MPDAVTHPTPQELAAFGLGKLTGRAAEEVARHLEGCSACRQAVAKVPPDSFLGKVHAARPGGSSSPARPLPGHSVSSPSIGGGSVVRAVPADVPPELANHSRYRVLRELGRGGMGIVYQARQTAMNREVVIKVINKALLDHPDAVERFQREVQAAAQLSHPHIVTAYDAEQAGSLHMLVMEFVRGQSLAEVLQKKGPLPVASACHFVRQAALGLQHAFEQGMVHRDIKPQNLMVTPKGQVKILDFGLAKMARERDAGKGLTSTGAYMGTPDYSAPEQATNARTADIRADIYSLGCTLYCLVCGRPPFQEETSVLTILAHMEKEPAPLPELRADVSVELWQVVARLLAKDPAQRYQKPIEVAQALVPFIKPGARQQAGAAAAPAGMGSPGKGTWVGGDTGRLNGPQPGEAGKAPTPEPPAKQEVSSPFEGLTDAAPLKKATRSRSRAKPMPAAWHRRWPVLAGVVAAVVGLGLSAWLLAGVVFKEKVKTAEGEAFIVVKADQPGAIVLADGEEIGVQVPGDNKPLKIKMAPGRHKLRITKDGFVADTREIEVKTGESGTIQVRLEPVVPAVRPQKETEHPTIAGEPAVQSKNPTATAAGPEKVAPPAAPQGPESRETAGEPATERENQTAPADEFVSLFNGKDLTGWKASGKVEFFDRSFDKQGVLTVKNDNPTIGPGNGVILCYTRRDFSNFRLRFEAVLSGRWCSELCIRSSEQQAGYLYFIKAANSPVSKNTGGLIIPSIRELPKQDLEALDVGVLPGQFFKGEIIASGNHLVFKVNDRNVVDYIDPDNRFKTGAISFRIPAHCSFQFRRLEVKELPPDKVLKTGDVWEGSRESKNRENRGQVQTYRFVITSRVANSFEAKFWLSDQTQDGWKIVGKLAGDRIDYEETGNNLYRMKVVGTVKGNRMTYKFSGRRADGGERYGEGEVTLKNRLE